MGSVPKETEEPLSRGPTLSSVQIFSLEEAGTPGPHVVRGQLCIF